MLVEELSLWNHYSRIQRKSIQGEVRRIEVCKRKDNKRFVEANRGISSWKKGRKGARHSAVVLSKQKKVTQTKNSEIALSRNVIHGLYQHSYY